MIAVRVQSLIGRARETVTYKRVTHGAQSTATLQSTPSVQSYTIKAGVRQYRAREIAGLVRRDAREVWIAAADLSFAPRPNDQVVIDGKTYQVVSVNTRTPFDEAAIHLTRAWGGHESHPISGARCVTGMVNLTVISTKRVLSTR
jgi:hypothetical protein